MGTALSIFTSRDRIMIYSKSVLARTIHEGTVSSRQVFTVWETVYSKKKNLCSNIQKTSWVDVADYSSQNGSPRPTLRKQYHMCKFIYEVLTRGPERISILLGKCFPLGSVSATAYRCFGHAENTRLFPPRHEWKSMLKVLLQPSSESDLQLILWCTSAKYYILHWPRFHLTQTLFSAASVNSGAYCSAQICKAGDSPATDVLAAAQQKQNLDCAAQECKNNAEWIISLFTNL